MEFEQKVRARFNLDARRLKSRVFDKAATISRKAAPGGKVSRIKLRCNDAAATEIYAPALHDALRIWG
ncbi:MAG: hypothetical protein GY944_13735 [bacterium]|nr:hypothetical protein [bacterium]